MGHRGNPRGSVHFLQHRDPLREHPAWIWGDGGSKPREDGLMALQALPEHFREQLCLTENMENHPSSQPDSQPSAYGSAQAG